MSFFFFSLKEEVGLKQCRISHKKCFISGFPYPFIQLNFTVQLKNIWHTPWNLEEKKKNIASSLRFYNEISIISAQSDFQR